MTTLRDIRRAGRRDLHSEARVPALYLLGSAEPVPVNVRVHDNKVAHLGGAEAPNYAAERAESTPRVVFDLLEITPVRSAVVSVAAGEAYRVARLEPAKGEFQIADVTRLSASEAAGLPVPA